VSSGEGAPAPFATVDDLEESWRPLSEAEKTRATRKLASASRHVRGRCRGVDRRIENGDLDPAAVMDIVCNMVERAMKAPVDQLPVNQQQSTAGPFGGSVTFANPTGDLYLTKQERLILVGGTSRAGTVNPFAGRNDPPGEVV
jgi:hypothetical protein